MVVVCPLHSHRNRRCDIIELRVVRSALVHAVRPPALQCYYLHLSRLLCVHACLLACVRAWA